MDLGTSCRPWPLECVCVGPVVVDPLVMFSFVLFPLFALLAVSLFPLFCPLVSVLLFPCAYLSLLGLLAWGGVTAGLGVTPRWLYHCPCCGGSSLLSYCFFCYSLLLGHSKASKRVMLKLA